MFKIILLLLLCPGFAGIQTVYADDQQAGGIWQQNQHIAIDIDHYVAVKRSRTKGKTLLIQPDPISFIGSVKQHPHPRKVSYLYEALAIYPMEPLPVVAHRMFMTTPKGHIMPLYVEKAAVEKIKQQLKEDGETVRFFGYHMFSYYKGPAIMVTSFSKTTSAEIAQNPDAIPARTIHGSINK